MSTYTPVIFVLLDAFRWDYLNPIDSPFLWDCSQQGLYVRKLITTCGFTQRSAIFCGTFPDKTKNFTMFSYAPMNSPFHFLKTEIPLLWLAQKFIDRKIRGSRRLNFWLRHHYIYPRAQKHAAHPPTAEIPLHLLPYIAVTEDEKPIYKPRTFKVESIFDIFQKKKLHYDYLMFPVVNCQDDEALERVVTHIKRDKGKVNIYFVQFSDSDLYVHKHGTESIMRRKIVGELDRKIRELWYVLDQEIGNGTLVIVGDHGMMDVVATIDVGAIVHHEAKSCGLRHGRDYFLFLDSTFARIWDLARSRATKKFFQNLKSNQKLLQRGDFLSLTIAEKYRIPYSDRKYGDIIWWAAPGVLIYPDYFHRRWEQYKAMHGYDPLHDKMKGLAIIWGKTVPMKVINEAYLIDICPTLCDLLGIPRPSTSEGVSLLDY